ncbi:hypothetical protein ACFL27_02535 [candidate division CSSED10-310 bacterium]|uniref:Uncharacterized protein n=1 Tax=candidate division CSSED10-310 bacterium TaxID=2855610 RepID=A0ABV6YS93_UNCC1
MKFILSISVAISSGALATLCAGFIAWACIEWYNISSFEGKAGYFLVAIALLGGMAGLIIGFVTNWIITSSISPGFFKGLGISWGIVVVLSALGALFSWLLADIPPEIDGYLLDLAIEFRLSTEETEPPQASDDTFMTLQCLSGRVVRKMQTGTLDLAAIRQEDGYWILPATAYIFTSRGKRLIHLVIDDETAATFIVPLPRWPGRRHEKWSKWLLYPTQEDSKWRGTSYRFRVQRIIPSPPSPDPEVPMADAFTALDPGSPLIEWLEYVNYDQLPERINTAMSVIESRQEELAQLIRSDDIDVRESAMVAVIRLIHITPVVTEAVLADGKEIETNIRRFNTMTPTDPEFYNFQVELRSRFSYWHRAWWNIHQRTDVDARPPVQNILDLAEIRAKETSMDEIVINARAHLDGIPNANGVVK